MVDRRFKRLHELLLDAVGDKTLGEVQQIEVNSMDRHDETLQVLNKLPQAVASHLNGNVQLQLQWKRPNQIPEHILRSSILRPEELKELDERLRPAKAPYQEHQHPCKGCQVLGRRLWRHFMPETMVPITLALHPLGRCWKAAQHRRRYNTRSTKNTKMRKFHPDWFVVYFRATQIFQPLAAKDHYLSF